MKEPKLEVAWPTDPRPPVSPTELVNVVVQHTFADVALSARAPAGQTVAFRYTDPGGGQHHALNCSIAEVRLRVERPGRPALELATAHGGAYELGVPEAPAGPGISVQPFPDP